MNTTRRRVLAALGFGSASVAAVLGSGAFSAIEAERGLTVDVVDDGRAFFVLAPNDDEDDADGGISTVGEPLQPYGGDTSRYLNDPDQDTTLELLLTDDNIDTAGGVNDDAVVRFSNLIRAENRGTQDVAVRITNVPDGLDFFAYGSDADGPVSLVTDEPPGDDGATFPVELDLGAIAGVTVQVDTNEFDTSQLEETIAIIADANGELDRPDEPDL